jgi:hypothetical protein
MTMEMLIMYIFPDIIIWLCVCQLMKQEGMGDVGVYHCVCVRVEPTVHIIEGFQKLLGNYTIITCSYVCFNNFTVKCALTGELNIYCKCNVVHSKNSTVTEENDQPLLAQYKQQANPLLSMNNYTQLVISRNDKNKQIILLSQRKLALSARNTLFVLKSHWSN